MTAPPPQSSANGQHSDEQADGNINVITDRANRVKLAPWLPPYRTSAAMTQLHLSSALTAASSPNSHTATSHTAAAAAAMGFATLGATGDAMGADSDGRPYAHADTVAASTTATATNTPGDKPLASSSSSSGSDDGHATQIINTAVSTTITSGTTPSTTSNTTTRAPTTRTTATTTTNTTTTSTGSRPPYQRRPRCRHDEVNRVYGCNWGTCDKAYGTLNHLNHHVALQRHGPKRTPAEFRELRQALRNQRLMAQLQQQQQLSQQSPQRKPPPLRRYREATFKEEPPVATAAPPPPPPSTLYAMPQLARGRTVSDTDYFGQQHSQPHTDPMLLPPISSLMDACLQVVERPSVPPPPLPLMPLPPPSRALIQLPPVPTGGWAALAACGSTPYPTPVQQQLTATPASVYSTPSVLYNTSNTAAAAVYSTTNTNTSPPANAVLMMPSPPEGFDGVSGQHAQPPPQPQQRTLTGGAALGASSYAINTTAANSNNNVIGVWRDLPRTTQCTTPYLPSYQPAVAMIPLNTNKPAPFPPLQQQPAYQLQMPAEQIQQQHQLYRRDGGSVPEFQYYTWQSRQ